MFPPSAEYVLAMLGFSILGFCSIYLVIDHLLPPVRFHRIKSFAATFSRYSLSAYILHHIVHVWPMWIYAVAQGEETTYYWQKVTTVPGAILLACIYFATSFVLFRWMQNSRRPAVESAMRWVCDSSSKV